MWPNDFKGILLDRLLHFVWGQWAALGVPGTEPSETRWLVDPEPLLIFSLEVARFDPRLFDEILAWFMVNGERLDTARLRSLIRGHNESFGRVLGGTLQFALSRMDHRKWGTLAGLSLSLYKKQPVAAATEPLFKEKSGKSYPLVFGDQADPDFMLFYINRSRIQLTKTAQKVPMNRGVNLRFLLRSLFGIGGRSECLVYLLTHEEGRPREIAESAGLFWLGIQQTLADMTNSGLISARRKGRGLEYWIPQKRWWDFLAGSAVLNITRPRFLNAMIIFPALSEFWRGVEAVSTIEESHYLKASKARESLERLHAKLMQAGLDVPAPPAGLLSEEVLVQSANQILDLLL